jgi:hypothetical protein
MHPDQATDSIVDAALMYSKPFAVVVIKFLELLCALAQPLPSALLLSLLLLLATAASALLLSDSQLPNPFTA